MHSSHCFPPGNSQVPDHDARSLFPHVFALEVCRGEQAAKQSGTSLRELPSLFERPMSDGSLVVVDSEVGSGSKHCPWSTINHPLSQVAAGDTLYLREGRDSKTSSHRRITVNDSFDRFFSVNQDCSQFVEHRKVSPEWQNAVVRFAASAVGRREKSAGYYMSSAMFKRQSEFGAR